jgi:serine/threonine protein kinase
VKIGDFGVSKRAKKGLTKFKTGSGTEHYQAPEIQGDVDLEYEEEEYTNIVDMWSLGCVVFEMAASTVIFPMWPRDYKRLCWGRWYPDQPRGLSQKGWDFIKKLLVLDPTRRLSAVEALKHEWIASRDPQPLTGKVIEGPGPTAPPPNNAPGLDSEDFRHTMTPSRARFSGPRVAKPRNRAERFGRPVDTNSIKVERSQGNSPANVPGASAMKTRTWTTVLQSGNNGKIQAGNGYENDALAASSAKLPQIMSSSGEHGDDNPTASSQRRTAIRRVSHANISDSVSADDPHHGERASSIQVIAPATEQVKGDHEPAGKSQRPTIVRRTVEQPSIPDDDINLFPDSSDDMFAASSDEGEGFKSLFSEPLPPVTTSKVNAAHVPSTRRVNGMSSASKTVAQPSSEAAEDRIDPGYGLKLMFEEKPQAMAAMNGSQTAIDRHRQQKSRDTFTVIPKQIQTANDRYRQQKSRDTFTLVPKQSGRRVKKRRGRQVPRDDSDDDSNDDGDDGD